MELKELFEQMKTRYITGQIEEPVVFYFSLGETDADKWTLSLEPDECSFQPGKVDNADCFLKAKKDLFIKMIQGDYRPGTMDFMTGKLKSNDPFKLALLEKCFKRD